MEGSHLRVHSERKKKTVEFPFLFTERAKTGVFKLRFWIGNSPMIACPT